MKAQVLTEPFPHLIVEDLYEDHELELIWEELNFFTKPGKLMLPLEHGAAEKQGGEAKTSALAFPLTSTLPGKTRRWSNILTLETAMFQKLKRDLRNWKQSHYSLYQIPTPSNTYTKLRYYHNDEGYATHADHPFAWITFSYFYKEPKKFTGGELFFEDFDNYEFPCNNNSLIAIPPYVAHGVRTVKIDNDDYYSGNGRYAITTFVDYRRRSGANAIDFDPLSNEADLIDWWNEKV